MNVSIRSILVLPFVATALAATLVSGCGRTTAGAASESTTGASDGAVEVSTAPVSTRDVPVTVQATGSFVADEVSNVAPETSGQVAATPVQIGDRVQRGSVIARLKTEDAQLRLDQARASEQQAQAALAQARERYNLARANAGRYDALVKTGDVSKTLHEQATSESETSRQSVATAEAAVAEARSRVALAQKALDDTVIRAPFDGFITDRPVAAGEYVTTSSKIATVMKLDPIRLRLQVPELESAGLRKGQTVNVHAEALSGHRFSGRITAINPALDPGTRATMVEVTIANREGLLRAGMFAQAEVALGDQQRALFVPRDAVTADPNTSSFHVFIVADGTARLRVVQPGPEQDGTIRILSGIDAGDHVVVSGREQLFDGATVTSAQRMSSR